MDAADLLAEYCAHLVEGAERLERGEVPTDEWRRERRSLDARLRRAGDGLGLIAGRPDGARAVARWKAVDRRFRAALRGRMAAVDESRAASGRSRRAHRTYRVREDPPAAYYMLQRS
jgi:hypothetical protein